jgi:excisionase family DNA binding protein
MDATIKKFSNLSDFLTISEVATLARVHEVSVRRWISSGALRSTKFGGVTRIQREDLEAFIVSSGSNQGGNQ